MSISGRTFALFAAVTALVLILPLPAPWGILIPDGLLVLAVIADIILAPATKNIVVERVHAPTVGLNTSTSIEWRVSNHESRRVHVRIADDFKPSLRAASRRASVWIPSNGRISAETTVQPSRRGRFLMRKVTVRVYGPWGLAARQRTRDLETILRVYPSFNSRREVELRLEKAQVLEIGLRSVRSRGGGTDFDQLREYTVDDDFRRIDWAASARASKPIVRTYRAERNQNVMILLDCGRVMAGRISDVPRLEHAMDAVMALSTVATRLGDSVGLIAFDQRVRSEVGMRSGTAQIARVNEALFELEPELLESDYRNAFVRALNRNRRRSLVVVLTELAEQAVAETLIPALPLVSKRHLVVVSSVRDPAVADWSRAIPTEIDKAYRKAAAGNALESRRRIVANLKSRGATVIDAAPGRLAAELADTYLQVKASGRL
jgi:uncharacterized protein (DUF58 family)